MCGEPLHPIERDYTCLSAAHGTLSRIDYLLISENLFPKILEAKIEPIFLSDHALCWFRMSLQIDRGTHRQWRFPSHLVDSLKFREALNASWETYAIDNEEHASSSPLLFWQAAKSVIRGNIMSYTTHSDKCTRELYRSMQQDLTSAYISFKDDPSPSNRTEYV